MFWQLLKIYFATMAAEVVGLALVLCRRHRIVFVYIHPAHWIFYHLNFSPFAKLFDAQEPPRWVSLPDWDHAPKEAKNILVAS